MTLFIYTHLAPMVKFVRTKLLNYFLHLKAISKLRSWLCKTHMCCSSFMLQFVNSWNCTKKNVFPALNATLLLLSCSTTVKPCRAESIIGSLVWYILTSIINLEHWNDAGSWNASRGRQYNFILYIHCYGYWLHGKARCQVTIILT